MFTNVHNWTESNNKFFEMVLNSNENSMRWVINIFIIVWNLMLKKLPFKFNHSKNFKNDLKHNWSFVNLWICSVWLTTKSLNTRERNTIKSKPIFIQFVWSLLLLSTSRAVQQIKNRLFDYCQMTWSTCFEIGFDISSTSCRESGFLFPILWLCVSVHYAGFSFSTFCFAFWK